MDRRPVSLLPLPFAFSHLCFYSGDEYDKVCAEAETAIKHRVSALDIEKEEFAKMLYGLLLGDSSQHAPSSNERRSPCNAKFRTFAMAYMLRCVSAAALFPGSLQTVFLCLNDPSSTPRLRVLGLMFTHHLFEHSPAHIIEPLGKILFSTALMKIIKGQDATAPQVQALAYSALGKLSRRLPGLFRDNIELLSLLFTAASTPDAVVSPAVTEALHLLRDAYAPPSDNIKSSLLALLQAQIASPISAIRLISIQYADAVFGKHDPAARFLCIVGTSDEKEEVRVEARIALFRLYRGVASSLPPAETFYPDFGDMLAYVCTRIHGEANLPLPLPRLPFPSSTMAVLISYLRCVLGVSAGADEDDATFVARTGRLGARLPAISTYLKTLEDKAGVEAEASPLRSYHNLIQTALVCCWAWVGRVCIHLSLSQAPVLMASLMNVGGDSFVPVLKYSLSLLYLELCSP